MGKTAFSGPIYGAKSLLWTVHRDNTLVTSSLTQTIAGVVVPTYEEWYVTEFRAFRGSTGSTDCVVALVDDSTTIGSVAFTSSLAGVAGSTTLTATPGEYEGLLVAAGSSLSITLANAGSTTVGSSDVTAWAYGFIRFVDSTRAS